MYGQDFFGPIFLKRNIFSLFTGYGWQLSRDVYRKWHISNWRKTQNGAASLMSLRSQIKLTSVETLKPAPFSVHSSRYFFFDASTALIFTTAMILKTP